MNGDWSNTSNPNGAWTYRERSNALPFVADYTLLGTPFAQPGWAPSNVGGDFLPGWFQLEGVVAGWDALDDDIVVHSRDDLNGGANGEANVIWTSPASGNIDVSGQVWSLRDIGRSNDWLLLLNGVEVTSGSVGSSDPFDRDNPF